MKKVMKKIMMVLVYSLSVGVSFAWAHEGHDHDAPKLIQAPKGGIIKSLEKTNVEVVSMGKDIKIYLYNSEMKPQSVTGYELTAKAEFPRTKKQEVVSLTAKDYFYEANFDAKGAHRYTLLLTLKDPKTGHNDKLSFTIEPKK